MEEKKEEVLTKKIIIRYSTVFWQLILIKMQMKNLFLLILMILVERNMHHNQVHLAMLVLIKTYHKIYLLIYIINLMYLVFLFFKRL